eukprot:10081069-Lingulodinium_polyedra.AAC.1
MCVSPRWRGSMRHARVQHARAMKLRARSMRACVPQCSGLNQRFSSTQAIPTQHPSSTQAPPKQYPSSTNQHTHGGINSGCVYKGVCA